MSIVVSVPVGNSRPTLLQLIQSATGELGLSVPAYVVGNTATDTLQQFSLLNAVGKDLQRQHTWQHAATEYNFTTSFLVTTGTTTNGSAVVTGIPDTTGFDTTYVAVGTGIETNTFIQSVDSTSQVTLTRAATASGTVSINFCKVKYAYPADFDRPVDRTQWDKSKHWEMLGPEDAQQWEWLLSGYISTGPVVRWRLLGAYFQIWPGFSSTEVLGFEYRSKGWAAAANGTVKNSFTLDTDTCIFPDRVMVLGAKLKYFQAKGFDTTAMYRDWMTELETATAQDTSSANLSLAPRASNVLIGWNNIPDSGYGAA